MCRHRDGPGCVGQWKEVQGNEWVRTPKLAVIAYNGPSCYIPVRTFHTYKFVIRKLPYKLSTVQM